MDLLERLQGSIITPEDAAFWEIVGQLGPPARSEEAIGSLALPGLEEVATWVRCSNGSCACHETRFNPDGLIEIRDSKDLLSRAEPPVIAMTPEGYAEYFGRAAAPGDYDSFRVEDGNRFGQGMSLIAADVRLDFTPEETDAARFALAVKEPLVTIEGLNRTAEQDSGLWTPPASPISVVQAGQRLSVTASVTESRINPAFTGTGNGMYTTTDLLVAA